MKVQFEFEFVFKRCPKCGKYYAVESDRQHGYLDCPYCSYVSKDGLQAKIYKLERTIRGLRGHIKHKGDNQ